MRYPKKTFPELMLDEMGGPMPGSEDWGCSGDFKEVIENVLRDHHYGGAQPGQDDIDLTTRMSWGYTQWLRSNMPIIRLDPDLVELLLQTDVPDKLEELPPLPWAGFWVEAQGFELVDKRTGVHAAEGVMACADTMWYEGRAVDAILLLAVGEDKRGGRNRPSGHASALWRDDSVHYVGIVAEGELRERLKAYGHGIEEACRIVVNLLLLWTAVNNPLVFRETTIDPPKGIKKQKRLESQKRSTQKYWHVSVNPAFRDHKRVEGEDSGGPRHLASVRGHFRCYWVTDPYARTEATARGVAVLDEKISPTGKVLCKIRKFIAPHWAWRKGEGSKKNVYRAKAPKEET